MKILLLYIATTLKKKKLNVCCFRGLEDVNVFSFCVIEILLFVPWSQLDFIGLLRQRL